MTVIDQERLLRVTAGRAVVAAFGKGSARAQKVQRGDNAGDLFERVIFAT